MQALEVFSTGGWWHDVNILASTGKGLEEEEKTAWQGWWNESIADLVRLSMSQPEVLTILLTGRKESAFADLVSRMVKAKGLEFDMVCLKPSVGPNNQKIGNTMDYKKELLKDVVFTYTEADDLKMYEDRPKHTAAFRQFFSTMNRELQASQDPDTRPPFAYDVVQVTEQATTLDPVTEVAEVQRMINSHNQAILTGNHPGIGPYRKSPTPLAIKRTVFYTGYLLSPTDTDRLLTLLDLPPGTPANDVRCLANNILITPKPAPASILQQVGGIGRQIRFRVTHSTALENKLWAVKVAPTDPTISIYTENPVPLVVLALRKNARPGDANRIRSHMWQPVSREKQLEFETVVGEKVMLRIEDETPAQAGWDAEFGPRSGHNTRKHHRDEGNATKLGDEDFPPLSSSNPAVSAENFGEENYPQVQQLDPRAMQFGSAAPPKPQGRRNDHNYTHDRPGGGVHKNGQRGGRSGNKNFGARGGRGGMAGGSRGGRGGRQRGNQYRSLDDSVGNNSYGGGGMQY